MTVRRLAVRSVAWAAGFLMLAAACTSDTVPVTVPADVETCDELVAVSVQLVEVWIDVLDQVPVEQLTADAPPPEFVELGEIGADLDARAGRLGCDPASMNAAVVSALADRGITADDDAAVSLLLDIIQGGVVGELPATPQTTTTTESP